MKNIMTYAVSLCLLVSFLGCELPRQREAVPGYKFTGFSRQMLEQKAEVLSSDCQISLQRYLDYNGTNNYNAVMLYRDARDSLVKLRNYYIELDDIRSKEDADYSQYKADHANEDKVLGVNYYALMKQTEETIKTLMEISPKNIIDWEEVKVSFGVSGW